MKSHKSVYAGLLFHTIFIPEQSVYVANETQSFIPSQFSVQKRIIKGNYKVCTHELLPVPHTEHL